MQLQSKVTACVVWAWGWYVLSVCVCVCVCVQTHSESAARAQRDLENQLSELEHQLSAREVSVPSLVNNELQIRRWRVCVVLFNCVCVCVCVC